MKTINIMFGALALVSVCGCTASFQTEAYTPARVYVERPVVVEQTPPPAIIVPAPAPAVIVPAPAVIVPPERHHRGTVSGGVDVRIEWNASLNCWGYYDRGGRFHRSH